MTLDLPASRFSRSRAQLVRQTLSQQLGITFYCSAVRLPSGQQVWRVTVEESGQLARVS